MPEVALSDRLVHIRARIVARQAAAGWDHPVRIIAVTKTHGVEAVLAAVAAGLDAVGENRVQEALAKQDAAVGVPVEWHLIGSLQQNKVRQVVGRFALIHSVDRMDLAAEISRRAATNAAQQVLVQVNCSGEPQKSGVEPEALEALLHEMAALPRLAVRGLMTMAALTNDEALQRQAFRRLRELRDLMQTRGFVLPELSMGMSGDYGVAVEEGATMIRLGTILFGARE